jgi:hypothetical protein
MSIFEYFYLAQIAVKVAGIATIVFAVILAFILICRNNEREMRQLEESLLEAESRRVLAIARKFGLVESREIANVRSGSRHRRASSKRPAANRPISRKAVRRGGR